MKCIGTGDGDAKAGKTSLAAEVAHQCNEGLNLLLRGRGRQNNRGAAQIGEAREGKTGVRKDFKIRQRRPVRIAAQVEIGVAKD